MGEIGIRFYPSNWLYNAGVIGFLKVLERCGENAEALLNNDGSMIIRHFPELSQIFDNWDELTLEKLSSAKKKVSYKNKKGGTQKYYYANQTEKSISERIQKLINKDCKDKKTMMKGNISFMCSFCGGKISNIKISKLSTLSQGFSNVLLTAEKTFPNSYWNNRADVFICPKCEFILLCHHIPLIRVTKEREIFINAPSFKIMWYLNKFAEKVLSKSKQYELRKILALSLMEFAQKVSMTLGAWSMMNIDMIVKQGTKIDYFSLPYELSCILLQKEIANLISETNEPFILENILKGNFSYLLNLLHRIMRYSVTGSNALDDEYLSVLKNRDSFSLKRLSKILPELYVKINSAVNKEVTI
ncbi:type I-B CRISPR-associated protein Cas8b1/Cst1 [Thermodesulfovibrio yellowstonii]|uniref:CRISPR-associated protein CXXC-CXXC domain-containing protein n=1 Tax=Thermodesulfovibrio yellowstonii TaxID=28262 RepID=A0A9W6GEQ4_9BACT|nr:type I-B CRISPR-associated protein Cas8b1/Cst1 [Thermodesulfovibrio islandicus]GLI52447.1 hypothetical protein TISLANDTSLP1_01400 [Thermodesulfovibrio islandicus]